jgi:hypothetical protein
MIKWTFLFGAAVLVLFAFGAFVWLVISASGLDDILRNAGPTLTAASWIVLVGVWLFMALRRNVFTGRWHSTLLCAILIAAYVAVHFIGGIF